MAVQGCGYGSKGHSPHSYYLITPAESRNADGRTPRDAPSGAREGGTIEQAITVNEMPTLNAIHPHLHLSFEKLTVYVPGVRQRCCSSNKNPAALFLHEYCGLQVEQHDPFYARDGVSGYLSTGQMCLVLGGGSQQSTSTLLRVLSGRSNQTDEVSGNILLNGMPVAQSLQSWRRLCPYISASDTTHSAVLTVRETFQFAAQCTSDGHQTKEEIDGRVNRMLKALALEDVGDTTTYEESRVVKSAVSLSERWL